MPAGKSWPADEAGFGLQPKSFTPSHLPTILRPPRLQMSMTGGFGGTTSFAASKAAPVVTRLVRFLLAF